VRALLLVTLALLGATDRGAASDVADWPQWRGPARDGKSPETGLLKRWPEDGPAKLWTAHGLGKGSSPPSVTREGLYIMGLLGGDETLFALTPAGQPRWSTPCGPGWTKSHAGTRCQPAVDGDRVFFITSLVRAGCVDAATGRTIWSVDALTEFQGVHRSYGNAESPVIVPRSGGGGALIVTPGGANATIVALDKHTGEPLWTTRALSQPAAYCSPILLERGGLRIVVTMVKEGVVGVNAANGEVLWFAPHRNKYDNHMVSPVCSDGWLYVTSGYGAGGQMFRLSDDGRSVAKQWEQAQPDTMHGGVVLVDGHLYGSCNTKGRGQWACVKAETGEVVYQRPWVKEGSVLYADGHLYCYGEDGRVALVPARPDATEAAGRFAVPFAAGQHCTHPVIHDGRLFIRYGETLAAFRVKE
jgi:outer membrane protein assembly factor BamB